MSAVYSAALPSLCRVALHLRFTATTRNKFRVWLTEAATYRQRWVFSEVSGNSASASPLAPSFPRRQSWPSPWSVISSTARVGEPRRGRYWGSSRTRDVPAWVLIVRLSRARRVVFQDSILDEAAGFATQPARPGVLADRMRRSGRGPNPIDPVIWLSAPSAEFTRSPGYALGRLRSRSAAGGLVARGSCEYMICAPRAGS